MRHYCDRPYLFIEKGKADGCRASADLVCDGSFTGK